MPDIQRAFSQKSLEDYRLRLDRAGLTFASAGKPRSIPASLTPMIVADREWSDLNEDCQRVLSGLEKTVEWLRKDPPRAQLLFGRLQGLEAEAAQGLIPRGLATVRHDLFFADNRLKILEVNTTIPAMQAYSDMIREAWVMSFYPSAKPLLERSNSRDLLQSLLNLSARFRDLPERPTLGIIAREGDSQITELQWLKKVWEDKGYPTVLGHPGDFQIKGGKSHLSGRPITIGYRHIFAEKIDPQSALAEACRHPGTYSVWNSVSAHLEIKGLLAELSRIAADPAHARAAQLSEEECAAVQARVPWTRLLTPGPGLSEEGKAVPDFALYLAQSDPQHFVLKSSAGYGGHSVLVGEQFQNSETQARLQSLFRVQTPLSWAECVGQCFSGAFGPWIVQSRVSGRKEEHAILGQSKALHSSFVDCSIFGGALAPEETPGGASRFSDQIVVNLGRGGGLLPLFMESEMQALKQEALS